MDYSFYFCCCFLGYVEIRREAKWLTVWCHAHACCFTWHPWPNCIRCVQPIQVHEDIFGIKDFTLDFLFVPRYVVGHVYDLAFITTCFPVQVWCLFCTVSGSINEDVFLVSKKKKSSRGHIWSVFNFVLICGCYSLYGTFLAESRNVRSRKLSECLIHVFCCLKICVKIRVGEKICRNTCNIV